ncbi:glutamate receptor ionotropic, NMDA 3A [Trichonephila clavipes]|nr:glutamate receptor ionotropic, NMDA 3A [Trichonephila clavipes]
MTLDVQSGAAHMVFTAFSVTSERSRVIDYSVPFYHSGVSCLTYTQERDVPLSAFLIPFSAQLWIAIFLCLNLTAIFAAIYEWLSPFGLNPWGRMRTRNFSLASALWVMWSLLFSHLVAFKPGMMDTPCSNPEYGMGDLREKKSDFLLKYIPVSKGKQRTPSVLCWDHRL